MKTEVIYELPNEEYHRGEAYSKYLSSTQLKWYLKSPKYAHLCMTDPAYIPEQTEAMRKGSLFHNAMEFVVNGGTLADYLDKLAVFDPPVNEKTGSPYSSAAKTYQEAYNKWFDDVVLTNKIPASDADSKFIEWMVASAMSNEEVMYLISCGKPDSTRMIGTEISVVADLETPKGNPMHLKCRADLLTSTKCVDWKSSSESSFNNNVVGNIIAKFNYDISAAFYQYILYKHTGRFYRFVWCFISTTVPNEVFVADADNIAFSSIEDLKTFDEDTNRVCVFNPGVMRMRSLLDIHAKCIDANEWPGSEIFIEPDKEGTRVASPELPAWVAKQEIKAYF